MDCCQFEVSPGKLCGRRGKLLRLSALGSPTQTYQSRCSEHSRAERDEAFRQQKAQEKAQETAVRRGKR